MKLICLIAGALLCASVLVLSHAAYANCECTCVNGQPQVLCQSTIDVPPICTPRVCPIQTPSVAPIEQPRIPPLNTSSCHEAQVLNPNTNMYEWRSVCR